MMSGSSRGPTDDGRIKPDVVAPGGYVRSCRAQEAGDTSDATWSNQYYLGTTGTSMATPNLAGAALVREYLVEIALRLSLGCVDQALLILVLRTWARETFRTTTRVGTCQPAGHLGADRWTAFGWTTGPSCRQPGKASPTCSTSAPQPALQGRACMVGRARVALFQHPIGQRPRPRGDLS